jgi:hypothetical protein
VENSINRIDKEETMLEIKGKVDALSQNQEFLDIITRPSLLIYGTEERTEIQTKGIEKNQFNVL